MDYSYIADGAGRLLPESVTIRLLIAGLMVGLVAEAFYNIFLHPLANVPGPFYCKISKLPWVRGDKIHSLGSGNHNGSPQE